MTRIRRSYTNPWKEVLAWTKAKQEKIEKHQTGHENMMNSMEAEILLKGKGNFIYWLSRRGKDLR